MSRLRMVAGKQVEDLLSAAPGALEADTTMRRVLIERLTPRLYSLVGVLDGGCFIDDLRGPLDFSLVAQAANDWRALELTVAEKAVLAYAEKGTINEAAVRKRGIDKLRAAGFRDEAVLLIATTIAYHNYAIRMAAAFDVAPR